jgi:hypothetical protein
MPVMPIGACIVAHATERADHTVHLLDLMFGRDARSDIESTVTGFKPEAVGLSIRNTDNVGMRDPVFYLDDLQGIVAAILQINDEFTAAIMRRCNQQKERFNALLLLPAGT